MKAFFEWLKDFRLAIFLMSLISYLKITARWRALSDNEKERYHFHYDQTSERWMMWKIIGVIFILLGLWSAPWFGFREQEAMVLMLIPINGYLLFLAREKWREGSEGKLNKKKNSFFEA